MNIAIMQPYAFPYIGYFKLIASVDEFIFLDNVSFIKKGFINRNSVLLDGESHRFTLPVSRQSQNKFINEHEYVGDFTKFLKLMSNSYSKCKYYEVFMPILESICRNPELNVAQWNANCIIKISRYLGLKTKFRFSSDIPECFGLAGQDRIICICEKLKTSIYFNLPGGIALYDESVFSNKGIQLKFINTSELLSISIEDHLVTNLSILDLLVNCDPSRIKEVL